MMGVAIESSVEVIAEFLFENPFVFSGVPNRDLKFVTFEGVLCWCVVWLPWVAVRIPSMKKPVHCLIAFFSTVSLARFVMCFVFAGDLAACETSGVSVCYYHFVGVVDVSPPVGVWY